MNDWNKKLEYSLSEQQNFDIALLKSYIPGCVSIRKTDIEQDKKGVDYIATLNGGSELLIDAKTREKGSCKYWKNGEAELALETWSVCETKKKGWTWSDSTNVDYILYTFHEDDWKKFYFIPFQILRKAFFSKGKEWRCKYGTKRQQSNSWTSECMFVPVSEVLRSVHEVMQCDVPQRYTAFEENWELIPDDYQIKKILLQLGYAVKDNVLSFMGKRIRTLDSRRSTQ